MVADKSNSRTKDYAWIRQFGHAQVSDSKMRAFQLGEDELIDEKTSRINTVNRQKSTIKMNEISAQKPETLLRKKVIDTSKISPQGMISTMASMTTPKTQTNFGSSKLGNVSSGKKNYHPRENKSYFASASKFKQVDWNSKSSSRVKLGLGDRKISEPRLLQPRTFDNSPHKLTQSQSTSKKFVISSEKTSPLAGTSP